MSSKRFVGEAIWSFGALGFNETCFGILGFVFSHLSSQWGLYLLLAIFTHFIPSPLARPLASPLQLDLALIGGRRTQKSDSLRCTAGFRFSLVSPSPGLIEFELPRGADHHDLPNAFQRDTL